jgi:predicted nucleic acid-binding protein
LRVQISGTWTGICRDPNDNMVVECAALAKAEFIVSGDKDLLSLAVYEQIRILSPAEYIRLPIAS